MELHLSMYKEKKRYLPKGVSPPGCSVVEVRERKNVDWLGDVLVNLLKNFCLRLFEGCPWLPSEGECEMERFGLLKKLWKGSTTVERMFFLETLGLCELSFAMLMMVRDNRR